MAEPHDDVTVVAFRRETAAAQVGASESLTPPGHFQRTLGGPVVRQYIGSSQSGKLSAINYVRYRPATRA